MAALRAAVDGMSEGVYLAENAKACGNDKFKAGKYADALDWYDKGIAQLDLLLQEGSELTKHAARGDLELSRAQLKAMKKTELLHAQIHTNKCKALCKVGRFGEARAAAAVARDRDPKYAAAIKAGAHAALDDGDAAGREWDVLRNYALRTPEDSEAQLLAEAWEELVAATQQPG